MPTCAADDGTRLAYSVVGDGPPLLCVPGGPMQAAAYLGDLGGLAREHRLVLLDLRGTGASAVPGDPASYRCDRLVRDVEAVRRHLGLDRVDVLGHSAGTNLVLLHALAHPDRVRRLVLVTPSLAATGTHVDVADRETVARLRRRETWFPPAFAALERLMSGRAEPGDVEAIAPFGYGRWDEAARTHQALRRTQVNQEAAAEYAADGAFDPAGVRAGLARLDRPALLLAGALDLNSPPGAVADLADHFADASLVVQPSAAHVPWLDDPAAFTRSVGTFLR